MTPAHHHAVDVAARFFGTTPRSFRAHLTWGPTAVAEVALDDLVVFVKAGANQNVHTEAAVIDRARRAGVPTVDVLGVGTDERLPGGAWMITRAAPGRRLSELGLATPTIARTLDDLAECYTMVHRVSLPGFGPLSDDGQQGRLGSWSQWQRQVVEDALTELTRAQAVPPRFVSRVRKLCDAFAPELDRAPARLLHADLGDGETFVDPASGALTAIVDWGSALVGDPLYDLARFVGGGPADDPRPGMVQPTLLARYFERDPYDREHAQRMLTFYRFHICVVEAAWGEDLGWTPGHVAWAERLIDELTV